MWLPVQLIVIVLLERLCLLPSDLFEGKSEVYSGALGHVFNYNFSVLCAVLGVLYTFVGTWGISKYGLNTRKFWLLYGLTFLVHVIITGLFFFLSRKTFPLGVYAFMAIDVIAALLLWLLELELYSHLKRKFSPFEGNSSPQRLIATQTLNWISAGALYLFLGITVTSFFSEMKELRRISLAGISRTASILGEGGYSDEKGESLPSDPEPITCVENVILIDMSGSMLRLSDTAVSGANDLVNTISGARESNPHLEQNMTVSFFNTTSLDDRKARLNLEHFCLGEPVEKVGRLESEDFKPSGLTPLYDAIGQTIWDVSSKRKPGTLVLMTIITDGQENVSRKYDGSMIASLIKEKEKEGWEFTFYGADKKAVMQGEMIGIKKSRRYQPTDKGYRDILEYDAQQRVGRYKDL